MFLTPEQLYEIQKIITQHHQAFMANTIGPQVIPQEVLDELRAKGLIKEPLNTIGEAYTYGQLLGTLENKQVASMSYADYRNHVRKHPVALTSLERGAMEMARQNAAQYCRGLGNRVDVATGAILIEADRKLRARMEHDIRTEVEANIANRETVNQLKSDLGWATKDWARDLKRIAVTEKVTAMSQGTADHFKKRYGADVLVGKHSMPDSCPHCARLYNGPNGPRVFKLSTLEAHGTNVGRKANDWQAVVGSTHPNCFTGDTLVWTARGQIPIREVLPGDEVLTHKGRWRVVTNVWETQYDGPLVELETAGQLTRSTPNHPYLSGSWCEARFLKKGSNLSHFSGDLVQSLLGDLDTKQRPLMGTDNRLFFSVLSGFSGTGMPITTVYFNGDFYIREGQVDVNGFQGERNDRREPKSSEYLVNELLIGRLEFTCEGLLLTNGSLSQFFHWHSRASSGLVRSLCDKFPLFRCSVAVSKDISVLPSTLNASAFFDSTYDSDAGNIEVLSDLLDSHQLIKVHCENEGGINLQPFTHIISPDYSPIVNVFITQHAGIVYNLTVDEDNSYTANGNVVHNCQCVMFRVPVGWGWNEEGELVPGGKVDLYESPEELELAMLQEVDLQKAFALQGHVVYQGIPIAIENKKNSVRKWTDINGQTGQTVMRGVSYGYAVGTLGADEDEVDVFVGPDPRAKMVYIIEQQNPHTGQYDEQKCFLGFPNQDSADRAYRLHYDNPDNFIVAIQAMDVAQFKRWLDLSRPKSGEMIKSGGPYIGPRGGKWADPQHTIPWKDDNSTGPKTIMDADNPGNPQYKILEIGKFYVEVDRQESDSDVTLIKKSVRRLEYVLNKYLGKNAPPVRIAVKAGAASSLAHGTRAQYDVIQKFIKVGTKEGHNSLYHEYGHFLDHLFGDHNANPFSSADIFATHNRKSDSVFTAFVDEMRYTESAKSWLGARPDLTDPDEQEDYQYHVKSYLASPREMFARYFDQWIEKHLREDGKNPAKYANNATERYTKAGGAFSDKDMERLEPHFQKVLREAKARLAFFSFEHGSHAFKSQQRLALVVPLPKHGNLRKAGRVGGKYIRRVPYWKDGKKKYRYYYRESAAARDVTVGEQIKLGKDYATVDTVDADGTIHLQVDDNTFKVAPGQWDSLLSRHYGAAYFAWAETRAKQSVDAVLRHVPKEDLRDLKGETDKERLADLKTRVPKVYGKLQQSFKRAGVNPFRAKQVLSASLERRGWEPEARAAVIGNVITHRTNDYRTTIRAAENLAGGGRVELAHVAGATDIITAQTPERDAITIAAQSAERELARLSELLAKAKQGDPQDQAKALAAALSSTAIHKLNLIAQAFPGLPDRAVEPAREIMLEMPTVAPKAVPKALGARTAVYVAGEGGQAKALNARFKLVEADDAIASHDPKTFNKRPGYPEGVQERAYHRDKDEQIKVQRNAQKLIPSFVVNTNPDAVNGAPIMGADGVVLGGNSRTMSMQLVYANHPEKSDELRSYLKEHAHQAGFTQEDVAQFKNPILVRVLENSGETKAEKRLLVRQMNESFTQAMDPRTAQVAMGRKLTDETLDEMVRAMHPDETLAKFLTSNRSQGFVNALQKVGIIDQRNANQYLESGTRRLNVDGRTLVSRILVGRAVGDADLLSSTPTNIVNNLASAVPFIEQAKVYGKGFDLIEDLKLAMNAYNSLQYRVETGAIPSLDKDMTAQRFEGLFAQQEMFGAHPITNSKKAMALLEVLIRKTGPNQVGQILRDYAEKASKYPESQASMFGPGRTAESILLEVTDEHLKGLRKSGGPYIGPRGGKWSDPEHTIPWDAEVNQPGTSEHLSALSDALRNRYGIQLSVSMRDNSMVLHKIVVPKENRNSGVGSAVLGVLARFADTHNKRIVLTPDESFGGKKSKLTTFYKRFGFVENKGKNKDYEISESMYREAQTRRIKKSLPPEIGAAPSQAGNRAPGPGLGVNYFIPIPKKEDRGSPKRGYFPAREELLKEKEEEQAEGALHVDKEDYDFTEPMLNVHPYEYPEAYVQAHEEARVDTEERSRYVKREPVKNARRPKNKVERHPVPKVRHEVS